MIIVKKDTYGGIDWHDSCTTVDYVKQTDDEYGYESVGKATQAIINDIVNTYPYEEEKIRNAFATGEYIEFPAKINQYDNNGVIIGCDYGKTETYDDKIYHESTVRIWPTELKCNQDYVFGQVDYYTYYKIHNIKQPVYAVIENFLAVTKGVDSIERIYHKPFDSYRDAKKYMDNFKTHDNYNTQMYIACFDINDIRKEWYDYQMKIIDILDKNPDLLYADSFSPYSKRHYENLTKQ